MATNWRSKLSALQKHPEKVIDLVIRFKVALRHKRYIRWHNSILFFSVEVAKTILETANGTVVPVKVLLNSVRVWDMSWSIQSAGRSPSVMDIRFGRFLMWRFWVLTRISCSLLKVRSSGFWCTDVFLFRGSLPYPQPRRPRFLSCSCQGAEGKPALPLQRTTEEFGRPTLHSAVLSFASASVTLNPSIPAVTTRPKCNETLGWMSEFYGKW